MHWRRKWQPTQCSCPENPRDGGAWWVSVYGVTQTWTRLTWLSSSTSIRKDNKHQKGQVCEQVLSLYSCVSTGNNLGKQGTSLLQSVSSGRPLQAHQLWATPSVTSAERARKTQSAKETSQIKRKLGRLCLNHSSYAVPSCSPALETCSDSYLELCRLWTWLFTPNGVPLYGNWNHSGGCVPVDLGSPRKQKEIQAEHHLWLNKTLENAF